MKQNRAILARTAKQGGSIVVECSGGCHAPPGVLPCDPDEHLFFDNANFFVGQVQKPVHEHAGDKVATPFGDEKPGDNCALVMRPQKIMAELGLKDCPWCSQGNKLPTSFHFKIFFGFFLDSKLYD